MCPQARVRGRGWLVWTGGAMLPSWSCHVRWLPRKGDRVYRSRAERPMRPDDARPRPRCCGAPITSNDPSPPPWRPLKRPIGSLRQPRVLAAPVSHSSSRSGVACAVPRHLPRSAWSGAGEPVWITRRDGMRMSRAPQRLPYREGRRPMERKAGEGSQWLRQNPSVGALSRFLSCLLCRRPAPCPRVRACPRHDRTDKNKKRKAARASRPRLDRRRARCGGAGGLAWSASRRLPSVANDAIPPPPSGCPASSL